MIVVAIGVVSSYLLFQTDQRTSSTGISADSRLTQNKSWWWIFRKTNEHCCITKSYKLSKFVHL